MKLQESGEMYLETILRLSAKADKVRSIDVAEAMNLSKPAISKAMSKLKNGHFLNIDPSGAITLTDSGREIAEKIYERHILLTRLLSELGVDKITASEDACKIEHVISDRTFDAICQHYQKHTEETRQ